MVTTSIPSTIDEISPQWLSSILQDAGSITAVEYEAVGAGVGILCSLARLRLGYEPTGAGPRSLFAKLPRDVEMIRALERKNRWYEREVRFYRELVDTVPVRTPHCYYAQFDPQSNDFVLLLEDLSDQRAGDQVAGCSPAEAELVVTELARLHAAWWQSPRLAELKWLPPIDDPRLRAETDQVRGALPAFLAAYGDRCPATVRRSCERLGDRLDAVKDALAARQRTLCHGDVRLDNLFFGAAPGQPPLTVCDWQLISPAVGAVDLAYFLTGSLDSSLRREHEEELMQRYHATLVDHGVRDYRYDECVADYRLATLRFLGYWMVAALIDFGNARGNALRDTVTERSLAANRDWRTHELIEA